MGCESHAYNYGSVLPGCYLKKIHRLNKDLRLCGQRFMSPLLPPDIELEDSQILQLLLLALSIANQLDRETLFSY